MKTIQKAIIYAIGAILVALIFMGTVKYRYTASDKIFVKGLGEEEFASDLIVWSGMVSQQSMTLADGYAKLEKQRIIVSDYLTSNGVPIEDVIFSFISNYENDKPIYNDGKYVGQKNIGYVLSQTFSIESADVDKIDDISRDISSLLTKGVNIQSNSPEYFYTKLDELKLQLIEDATKDAYSRAKTIADKAGSKVGKLATARMGVFQIVGKNTNEDYTWGGAFNTSSKHKKATIIMRLDYHIK